MLARKQLRAALEENFTQLKKEKRSWGIARKLGFKDESEFMASNPHLKKDEKGFVRIKAGDQLAILDGAVTHPSGEVGGAVGGHDKDGLTKATIGLGDVTIGGSSEVPDGVNRDVSSVQEMETNYDVQTIKQYFTNQDIEALIDGLIRKETEVLMLVQP
jgi:hypothetical protein